MKTHVHTHSESWRTDRIDSSLATFIQEGALRSGNPDLDRLFDTHSSELHGFPLREVTTTSVRTGKGREITSTETVEISHFRKMTFLPSLFEIPKGYRRVTSPFGPIGSAP